MGPNADQPKSPEAKPGSKPDVKDDLQSPPDAKAEPEPEVKAEPPADLTPRIAKRAYELYLQRVRQGDPAFQDWEEAEREIRKDTAKAGPEPEAKAETPSDLTPQIVKRAYELYEQRDRRDGQAGQDWLEAEREIRDESPK